MDDPWSIRLAQPEDAQAIALGERVCFSDPWSEAGILELLQSETTVGWVGEKNGRLAGYLLARTIAGEAEILNLAVLPESRRLGLGRAMLDVALAGLRDLAVEWVFLEVRESNDAARQLYERLGFHPIGLRPSYYRRPRENAFVLRLELGRAAIE